MTRNPIQELESRLKARYPDVGTDVLPPLRPGGAWSMDAGLDDASLTVEWTEGAGFSVARMPGEAGGAATLEAVEAIAARRLAPGEDVYQGVREDAVGTARFGGRGRLARQRRG